LPVNIYKVVLNPTFKSQRRITMTRQFLKKREQPQGVQPRQGSEVSKRAWGNLLTPSPFSAMRRFADEMDQIFEGFGFPPMASGRWGMNEMDFNPVVDIVERDGKLILRADLPGMTKDDVTVDISENSVLIEGERKYEHEENDRGVYRSERSYGHFRREIPLPEGVKTENATAHFKNGVLEVVLDASETAKNHRRIEIQGQQGDDNVGQTAA
jgi:HSP20 family protein